MIAAHVVLVLPFVIRSVMVSVANLDPMLERAAESLGARPWRVFWRVTLPLLRPGLFAALLFAVIVSVNEFVVSLFISTRVTEILPVAMFTYVVNYTDPTMAAVSTRTPTEPRVVNAVRAVGTSNRCTGPACGCQFFDGSSAYRRTSIE